MSPLMAACEKCGKPVFVKKIDDSPKKVVVLVYDCAPCGLIDHEDLVDRRTW